MVVVYLKGGKRLSRFSIIHERGRTNIQRTTTCILRGVIMDLPYRDGSDAYGQDLEKFLTECMTLATERHMEWRKKHAGVLGGSWGFDGKTGLLSFTFGGIGVSYAAQVVGSWSEKTQTFLWSWANSCVPPELAQAAEKVKAVGEERGCPLLTERKLDCDENLAMSLASAVSVMTDLPICYRAPGRVRLL